MTMRNFVLSILFLTVIVALVFFFLYKKREAKESNLENIRIIEQERINQELINLKPNITEKDQEKINEELINLKPNINKEEQEKINQELINLKP